MSDDRLNRIDVWEHRSTTPFEMRAEDDEFVLRGYASTFEPYSMYGGPDNGGWMEQLDARAFDETLAEKPDVHLLINHEGMPLARTKSGTLKLSVDAHGLLTEARLSRSDPDAQRLEAKMRRGDLDEMSFAFRVKTQDWRAAPGFEKDPQSLRVITAVSLHKGDVSVVNWGANPTTSVEALSIPDALSRLANADAAELVEARADSDLLTRAQASIEAMRGKPSKGTGRSLRDALVEQGLASTDGSVLSLADALSAQ